MKVIFLNGPPGCGKDTLADALVHKYAGTEKHAFAALLKCDIARAFGDEVRFELKTSRAEDMWLRENKDRRLRLLNNKTPRELAIAYSEQFIKPLFGPSYWGISLAEHLRAVAGQLARAVVSDAGFVDECMPIVDAVGSENCLLFRIQRNGKSFDNDSRRYIDLPNVCSHMLTNNGMIDEFVAKAEAILLQKRFINARK